ncbi:MAG: GNAT family N-acetyltransferase [Bacteroidales bacterium]|jgi:hypothetical protein|nr:GNAT family N-acetyltransferase [Bacteroidales bacterium]
MYKIFNSAAALPQEWNNFCKGKNIYLAREFLQFMEKVNDCGQRYYAFYKDKKMNGCFMIFDAKFNIFTLNKFEFKTKVKFIYIPLSASDSGIIFGDDNSEMEEVLNCIKGMKIILNTEEHNLLKNFTQGYYLPICMLENRWTTFKDYLNDMRSHYRHRFNIALKKGKEIDFRILPDNQEFSEEMYLLYEQVFNHSTITLEKLTVDYFKYCDIAKIITLNINDKTEAFVQIIEDGDTLVFEFGGFNYATLHDYDLYHNMQLAIVRYAIEHNIKYINLGQLAYEVNSFFAVL